MTAAASPGVRMVVLGREESLKLLASVPLGRVGFTHQALPVIRPVHHVVIDGEIAIRTHVGAALLSSAGMSEVVVYEADQIDPDTRTGWSVMVTGRAGRVTDAATLARCQAQLTPWVDMEMDMEHVVRILTEIVTGYRLVR